MKRLLALLAVAALLGLGTYTLCSRHSHHREDACAMPMDQRAEMRWLRAEFKLSDAQFARISTLHEAYQPKCQQFCAAIAASNQKVAQLIATSNSMTPELAAALQESAQVNLTCRQGLLEHVYSVSREMSPAEGRRYIAMMQERLVQMGAH